ncbi:Ig-like domain-containing protein, partial [Pseudomonas aeruginosa]|uniref:Ig-like domain-containing protein n=1 Tax=Pseudomonas aeruginosa TaxID=287 RepID=UPI001ABBCC7C
YQSWCVVFSLVLLRTATPTVYPSNGTTLSGTAEPGATVTLTDGNGNPIGQVTAEGSGNWSFTPTTPMPEGTVVNATATDASGNTSGQGSNTVDCVGTEARGVGTVSRRWG